MVIGAYVAMADAESYVPRESPWMGLTDTRVASLRAYQRYSNNATVDTYDLYGRLRWMGQKQARVHAIVHRLSSSHEPMTMHAIAKEASCAPSTVSRAILKFQSWGMFAIDVKRGRGGGISVRLRTLGDELAAYAERAWARLKRAAERVKSTIVNVASTHAIEEGDVYVSDVVVMDATFMEAWDAAEREGARLLAESRASDASIVDIGRDADPDREWERAQEWAAEVIAERRRLEEASFGW